MKKILLALLLCVLLAFPAMAENDAEYYFPVNHLNSTIWLAPTWVSLATEDMCVFPYTTENACVFYYLEDIEQYEISGFELPEEAVALAGIALGDEIPEGFDSRVIYEGTFTVSNIWTELDESKLPEGARIEKLEALIASFRDTDIYVDVAEPVTSLGDFSTTDLDGNEYTPAIFAGAKLTLVNVWATYCQPCLAEMPYLGELAEEYADKGVQIIGIPSDIFDAAGNVDADQVELAKRYIASTGADYTHLVADDVMFANLMREVYYVPNSWFMDSEGNVLGEAVVGSYSKEDWANMIDEHLALVAE